mgnify:CR=1 FL=1|jgi:hypothetical protein
MHDLCGVLYQGAFPGQRGAEVNYPPLTQGACSEDLMETTTMQFDSHEGCFSQPYSCRPVDAAPTDYPRNHGIIGYLLPTRQRTSYASSSVVETSSSGVSVSALVHSGSTRGHKNIMEGAIPPPACAGGLLARRDEGPGLEHLDMRFLQFQS